MTEKTVTDVPFKCNHCHQTTYMRILVDKTWDSRLSFFGSDDDPGEAYNSYPPVDETWQILLCPNCDQANVYHRLLVPGYYIDDGGIIYPPAITYAAPKEIDLQFRSAIGVTHINPAAAANQFRVVLEMIWQQQMPKGTKKPALRGNSGMIQQLVKANVLSGSYADMADVLANIGNKGSHYDETSVTGEDAEMARRLCQTILEHVYRMRPEGLDLVQTLDKKFPRDSGWRDGQFVDKGKW